MLIKNKKLAKVSFFLFLFFSFLALGFTLTNTVSAYTSQDMPEGYRPITYEDQGKIIGVDLEPLIYFDTSVIPLSSSSSSYFLRFGTGKPYFTSNSSSFKYFPWGTSSNTVLYDNTNNSWSVDSILLPIDSIPYEISISFEEEYVANFYNSFIYVKDIVHLSLIDSILSLFNNLIIWIPSVITGLILMFYSSETGLTFLGALAVAGLGISVIFLLIGIIQNFLHFRG